MDLSFPKGVSLNDYVSKDEYLGEKIELVYAKVDNFIQLIKQKGIGCLLFKTDLRRAFHQLNLCPYSFTLYHYANMSVQYTAIFHGCKNGNFHMKKCEIFLNFAQNIDRWYTLEPPH